MEKIYHTMFSILALIFVLFSNHTKTVKIERELYKQKVEEYENFSSRQKCLLEYPDASILCIERKINDLKNIIDNQKCLELVIDYRTPHSESYNEPCGYVDPYNKAVNSGLDFCIEKYDRLKNECGIDYWDIY